MNFEVLGPLIPVFMLGAMSPGPSLAVVLQNSVSGGRRQGVATAVGHGLGYGVYAFFAALGFAAAIASSDELVVGLRALGVVLLLYLAYVYGSGALAKQDSAEGHGSRGSRSGFVEGAFIAIFNPKILAWMLAIFSPFIQSDFELSTLLAIAATGMIIDGSWYTAVALFLTTGGRSEKLKSFTRQINSVMAALMLVFATVLVVDLV